jgi:hypothetical protein
MTEVDLRPMTLGEVLDRTFKLYKSNFWLFAGITALPYLLILLAEVGAAALGSASKATQAPPQISPSLFAGALAGGAVVGILYLLMTGAAHAATVFAVSDLYLARPVSVRGSFARVGTKVFRVLFVFFLIGLVIGGGVVLIAIAGAIIKSGAVIAIGFLLLMVPAIIFVCRAAVAIPVAMLEDIGAARSLGRSLQLTKGHAGQIFLIFLLVVCLSYVALLILQAPFMALVAASAAAHQAPSIGVVILQYLAMFVSQVLIGPIGTIAFSLMYYNLRVRKEAFDIQHLMASLGAGTAPSAPSAA